ncbi:MAG: DUF4091 domain-containing protein [Planctomycetaceae bacterium]
MARTRPGITSRRLALVAAGVAFAGSGGPGGAVATAASLDLWTAPAALKVFRDDTPAAESHPAVAIEAAAGERESAQVVLRAADAGWVLRDATLSDFRDADDTPCPELRGDLFEVRYVYLPEHDRAWPDPLPPFRGPLPLLPGLTQPLWLSVTVPRGTRAGRYRATLRLAFDSQPDRDVPVSLRVHGFELPPQPALRTAIGNPMEFVLQQHDVQPGTADAAALAKAYYEFLLDRRLSPYNLPCDLESPEAARWLDDPRLTSFVIPWNDDEAVLRRTIAYLAAHDWLRKGFFYVWDEPQTEEDFERLAHRARRIRGIDPAAAVMVPFNGNPAQASGRSTYERLDGLVDQWCPLSTAIDVPEQAARAARGAGSWWYVCCVPRRPRTNLMVDWPAVAHRVLPWQQKQRGVDGFLYWSATSWDRQFTRDPWTNIRTYAFKGDCYGDGSLLYPGDRAGIAGPVGSIRLEVFCDGMDDFDYLTLYERRRGRDAMLDLTRRATTSLASYPSDPLVLDVLRREMAEFLEQDATAPPISGQGTPEPRRHSPE